MAACVSSATRTILRVVYNPKVKGKSLVYSMVYVAVACWAIERMVASDWIRSILINVISEGSSSGRTSSFTKRNILFIILAPRN